ncbi:hypothetical protein SAMN04487761_1632 [Lachnospiraceae bacterium C7]|nr:hypothetical protein SAMN04487761_1632 [Lachnospiraceae bacterium C7]
MLRGVKRKLLIGLLTATVVGTSLAPCTPFSEDFTQEVKAQETPGPAEGVTADVMVMKKVTITPISTLTWDSEGNATEIYSWPSDIPKEYYDNEDDVTFGTKLANPPQNGNPVDVYILTFNELEKGKSDLMIYSVGPDGQPHGTQINDILINGKAPRIGLTYNTYEVDQKDEEQTLSFSVKPAENKKITDVTAIVNGNPVSVTKEGQRYKLNFKATSDHMFITIKTSQSDFEVKPVFENTLSSDVGTLKVLKDSANVEKGENLEFMVVLKDPSLFTNVTAERADGLEINNFYFDQEKGTLMYTILAKSLKCVDPHLKIYVEGHLDNNGLPISAADGKKEASILYTKGKNFFIDAEQLLKSALGSLPNDEDVSIVLKALDDYICYDEPLVNAVEQAKDYTLAKYMYITVDKTVGSDMYNVPSLEGYVDVSYYLPRSARGRKSYKVLRSHAVDGVTTVSELTTQPNADGEYITLNPAKNVITMHLKNFSEFAVLYSDSANDKDASESDKQKNSKDNSDDNSKDNSYDNSNRNSNLNASANAKSNALKGAKLASNTSVKVGSTKTSDYPVIQLIVVLISAVGLLGVSIKNSMKSSARSTMESTMKSSTKNIMESSMKSSTKNIMENTMKGSSENAGRDEI